ncbi:hypothetical protein L6164_037497 [Bauhinia variegata]|uniref:Uncharacterized protein n=1 Tax=Bauhinia variegata TaxID=167791 RepID=A0ACB9KK89_BAUVA|nr:hypothetical protein L6164_037497 [Bauhinia variegata]
MGFQNAPERNQLVQARVTAKFFGRVEELWFHYSDLIFSTSRSKERVRDAIGEMGGIYSRKRDQQVVEDGLRRGVSGRNPCDMISSVMWWPSANQGGSTCKKTPLLYLNKITEGCGAYITVKQEMMQPTASIKDRPA